VEGYNGIKEAIKHAATALECKAETKWIEAEDLEKESDIGLFFKGYLYSYPLF